MRKLSYLTTTALLTAGLLAAPAFAAGNDAHMNTGTGATGEAPAATADMNGSATTTGSMKSGSTKAGTNAGVDMQTNTSGADMKTGNSADTKGTAMKSADRSDAAADARNIVDQAATVVQKMKQDPKLAQLMQRAKGIYIVPNYAKGGLIAGAHGGEGVVLAKQNGKWGSPAFYDMGAVSIGAQAGFQSGAVAMLLMDQNAIDSFKQQNNWSLDADADLTVVDYSAMTKASGGKGDIVMWSDVAGAFAGGDISVSDISFDEEDSQAFYGKSVTAQSLLNGTAAQQAHQPTTSLQDALTAG